MTETTEDRLERYRIEGAVSFIDGIIKGAKENDDDGMLFCAENLEKTIRRLRVDKATLTAENERLRKIEAAARAVDDCWGVGTKDQPRLIEHMKHYMAELHTVLARPGVDEAGEGG